MQWWLFVAAVVLAAGCMGPSVSVPHVDWRCGEAPLAPSAPLAVDPFWALPEPELIQRVAAAAGAVVLDDRAVNEYGHRGWNTTKGPIHLYAASAIAGPRVTFYGTYAWRDDEAADAFWRALGIQAQRNAARTNEFEQPLPVGGHVFARTLGTADVALMTIERTYEVGGLAVMPAADAEALALAQKACTAASSGHGAPAPDGDATFVFRDARPAWLVPLEMAMPYPAHQDWSSSCGPMPLDVLVDARTGAILEQGVRVVCRA